MTPRLSELRAACLPFVTRSLRGQRRRLAWAAAVVLSLVSLLGGLWLAHSIGARPLRTDLRWETALHEREVRSYTVYADTEAEERHLRRAVDRLARGEGASDGRVRRVVAAGCSAMTSFGDGGYAQRAEPDLVEAAQRAASSPICRHDLGSIAVPDDPEWARLVLDHDLVPQVRRYTSPLGIAATLTAIGMIAGAIVGLGLLILAPLLIGLQMAQEVHDNTLQPLTGTALTARHLAVGLASGPLAAIAIALSGPLVLWGIGAVASGHVGAAAASLVSVVAASALLVVTAQLVAMTLGRQRSPGIVTIVLAAALGAIALAGIALALEGGGRSTGGLVATLPGSASVLTWMRTFAPLSSIAGFGAHTPVMRIVLGTGGMLVLAGLGTLVMERKILARSDGLLSRLEATIATVVLAAMALVAVPRRVDEFSDVYLLSLFALLGPLQVVLMARVPVGSLPPKLRTIPLTRLLAEYGVALSIHLLMVLCVAPTSNLGELSLGGVLHLGWAVLVLGLMTVRGMATPTSVAARLWFGIVLVAAFAEFGIGAALVADGNGSVFPMWHAPPLAGLVYIAMLVWGPWSLLRGLRRCGATIT